MGQSQRILLPQSAPQHACHQHQHRKRLQNQRQHKYRRRCFRFRTLGIFRAFKFPRYQSQSHQRLGSWQRRRTRNRLRAIRTAESRVQQWRDNGKNDQQASQMYRNARCCCHHHHRKRGNIDDGSSTHSTAMRQSRTLSIDLNVKSQ